MPGANRSEYSRLNKQVKKQRKIDDDKLARKVAEELKVELQVALSSVRSGRRLGSFPRGVPIPARQSRICLVNLLQSLQPEG